MRCLAVMALASCTHAGERPVVAPPVPAAPSGCRTIGPDERLQAVLDDGPSGEALCLEPGRYIGPFRIDRRVTLWGPRSAILSAPRGSVLVVTGTGARVAGLTIDGTGASFEQLDAGVKVTGAEIEIEGLAIENVAFGVVVERSQRVRVVGNHVRGARDAALGLRGDTIRIWETTDSEIVGNLVEDGRDVVVWYSRRNRIAANQIVRGRYGAHFMYSHDSVVERNELRGGVVGVFAMYSRGIELRDNLIAGAKGVAGMAIGLKESGNVSVEHNVLVHDTVGIYIDASPLQLGDTVAIRGNTLRHDRTAIVFHSSGHRVAIEDNDFADNDQHVRVDGGGDATDTTWSGNYWDDYAGYDLDGDDAGDVPYEVRSASGDLVAQQPAIALFRGTPALHAVDAASHLDPLFAPKLVLVDERPRVSPGSSHPRLAVR